MTNYIWITTQKEMYHRYPDAPNEVNFLRNEHRHIFHYKVSIEVEHNERDIEFIMFKRYVDYLLGGLEDLGDQSCEMISDWLAGRIQVKHPNRHIKIEVSEDGENGTEKFYDKSQSLNSQTNLNNIK